jgi:hypothetical protein
LVVYLSCELAFGYVPGVANDRRGGMTTDPKLRFLSIRREPDAVILVDWGRRCLLTRTPAGSWEGLRKTSAEDDWARSGVRTE